MIISYRKELRKTLIKDFEKKSEVIFGINLVGFVTTLGKSDFFAKRNIKL